MKILFLFLPSILPDTNHGGSTKIIKDISLFLAKIGHNITILCNKNENNHKEHYLHDNLLVKPILQYRQSWQDTYLVPPYQLTNTIQIVLEHAKTSDRIVVFDSHFLFQDIFPKDKPLIMSLRDFVYVQALQGGFLFRRDLMIVNSSFLKDAYCDSMSSLFPEIENRIRLIPNGIDLNLFKKVSGNALREKLSLSKDDWPIILFPHRPEKGKGIYEALEITKALTEEFPGIKLIVLRGSDEKIMLEVKSFYKGLLETVKSMGIERNVIFTDWLSSDDMPEFYSLGNVTLCIGDIVESFSNTTIESLACGVPVVASRIACFKKFVSDQYLFKVDVGNIGTAIAIIRDVIKGKRKLDYENTRKMISKKFNYQSMLLKYYDSIVNAKPLNPLKTIPVNDNTWYKIPAWISIQNGMIYNEYTKEFISDKKLLNLYKKHKKNKFTFKQIELTNKKIKSYLNKGFLVKTTKKYPGH